MCDKDDGNNRAEDLDFLYSEFLRLCAENNKEKAITLATALVDGYKAGNMHENILMLNDNFVRTFKEANASTPYFLIMKEAVSAAIQMIEDMSDEFPSSETATFICSGIVHLPKCLQDADFMLSSVQRIAAFYDSESEMQQLVIAHYTTLLHQLFAEYREWLESLRGVGNLDINEIDKTIKRYTKYEALLFNENTPVLTEGSPYSLYDDGGRDAERMWIFKELEDLAAILSNLENVESRLLPELRTRHEVLLDKLLNIDTCQELLSEIEVAYGLVTCYAMWRFADIDYAKGNIEPYAQKLLSYEPDASVPTRAVYWVQTVLIDLLGVYEIIGDAEMVFHCSIKHLRWSNSYFKRICFEHGIDHFVQKIRDEYPFYHCAAYYAASLVLEKGFPANELYHELCKRKNMIYLGEMWRRQGISLTEINSLLKKDFSYSELCASIGTDVVLIDFYYIGVLSYPTETLEGQELLTSRQSSTCVAFSLTARGEAQLHFVAHGIELANHLYFSDDSGDSTEFFSSLSKRLFEKLPEGQSLIVCADGDINQLNIAALPLQSGYVTDNFPVRNIGSVMDIVQPIKRKAIKSALLYNAPYYNETEASQQGDKWEYLSGSEIEQEIVANTLTDTFGIAVERISGLEATKAELLGRARNASGILHISTHGQAADGEVSIITVGANIPGVDAMISDVEMCGGYLENTTLAVFALCFGAKQLASLQDSLSGFIKAALLSGVNSVIAPIKPIYDISTVFLLNEFYKVYLTGQLEGGRCSVAQALQIAVRRTRGISKAELYQEYGIELEANDEEYPFSDPKHWAAWVCFSAEEM